MLDQASALREVANHSSEQIDPVGISECQPVAIAITSGKGGVGKTNVVANLAVSLARLGKSAMILDADFGLANIDLLFGIAPRHNLSDYIFGRASLEDLIVEVPGGVKIIPASSGIEQMASLTGEQQMRLIRGLSQLGTLTDYLLIDTAAGISGNVIQFLLAAGVVIVVTAPEPTAIVDAYLVIKILAHRESQKRVSILVNSVSGRDEALSVFEQINAVSRRFLSKPVELLGFIERDSHVMQAVRQQAPVVTMFPGSTASRSIHRLAKRLHQQCEALKHQKDVSLSWRALFEQDIPS
jgi:flagellar biosynthesis protein FlhG